MALSQERGVVMKDLRKKKRTQREIKIFKKYGLRECGKIGGTPLFEPQELGYRCKKGHSYITWSEFKEHLWCYVCNKDYHYADECVLIADKHNPKNLPKQPKMIHICNMTPDGNHFHNIPKELL